MKVTIDRFEGDFAVVELVSRDMVDLSKNLVPDGAEEGDILEIRVDYSEADKRKKRIEKLTEGLWE